MYSQKGQVKCLIKRNKENDLSKRTRKMYSQKGQVKCLIKRNKENDLSKRTQPVG